MAQTRGRGRDVVAKAEVCRDDDAREVRALVRVIFPPPVRAGQGCRRGSGCEISLVWTTVLRGEPITPSQTDLAAE